MFRDAPWRKWLGERTEDRHEEEDRKESFKHTAAGRAVDEPRAPEPSLLAGRGHDDDERDSWDRNHQSVAESHGFSIGEMLGYVRDSQAAKGQAMWPAPLMLL